VSASPSETAPEAALSHLDADGRARMVDVGAKPETERTATAAGKLATTSEVVHLVRADGLPKADVLATARIAGISAAKRTSELIPLCHSLALSSVTIDFGFAEAAITIRATAKTRGKTGVEMEALTAVAVAGLTLHDMVKAADPAATLTSVRLLEKTGGKRGAWTRTDAERTAPSSSRAERTAPSSSRAERTISPSSRAERTISPSFCAQRSAVAEPAPLAPSSQRTRAATVLVASTSAAEGSRPDTTGEIIAEWLARRGFAATRRIAADAGIAAGVSEALAERPAVLITTGGTGVSPTDATPEATRPHLDRELPGIADAIRAAGAAKTPFAALSRGLAGVSGRTLVVNLPGSPGGVKDGLAVLDPILDHLLAQISGGGAHE
jgi:cyclic pyranopterin phosphate synthase